MPVHRLHYIDGFSVTVVLRHSNARRVDLSVPMAALRLLQMTKAICREACLAIDADRTTELANMM